MDCPAPRHSDEPEPALPYATLCGGCKLRLSRDLRRLPHLHTELASVIPGRGHGRGTGDGLPYDDGASECRSQIEHDLRYWTAEAAADRHTTVTVTTVAAMAGLLYGAVQWMIYRAWCADLASAISDVRTHATALLDPWITRRFPVPHAACPQCSAGTLTVTVYASDGDRRRSHVECAGCGESWLPEQWTRLGQRILAGAA